MVKRIQDGGIKVIKSYFGLDFAFIALAESLYWPKMRPLPVQESFKGRGNGSPIAPSIRHVSLVKKKQS